MSHLRLLQRTVVLAAMAVLPLALVSCTNAEARSACENIEAEAGQVSVAAESVYQDYVEDGIDPQQQHLDILEDHFEDALTLEENVRGNKEEIAFERSEAAAYILDGVDEQDPDLVTEGADRMVETEEAILDAC